MARHWWHGRRTVAQLATLAAGTLVLAACGSNAASGGGSASANTIVPAYVSTSPFTADFNPLSSGATSLTLGTVYEPLIFFDTAQAGNVHPWLATSYKFGNAGKSLTFTLRYGVTWNDGKPFNSADVAFTFNLIKQPTLNQFGLPLLGATANGPYSVTVNFSRPVYTELNNIAGHIYMLPEHIWTHVKNPATWLNPHPVGTGAYMVKKVTPQLLSLTARPHYYMPGMGKVKTYNFEYFSGNQTVDTAIENSQLGWAAAFVPNVNKLYVSKNPKNILTDIPLALGTLVPNMVKGPQTALPVREAISTALNRNFIDQTIYQGYNGRANPEAVLLPNFKNIASQQALSDSFGPGSATQAKAILEHAGYKMGSNGIFKTPQGQELTLNVQYPTGWTDGDDILQIAQQELKPAGINLTITLPSPSVYFSNLYAGNFQLIEAAYGNTPSPYSYYNGMLSSAITKPIGTAEPIGNFGRYKNPTVDSLLNTIAATTNTQKQDAAFAQIESIVKAQLPVIPIFNAENEIEFNSGMVNGYPTASNPYAGTPAWLAPDNGWVAMHMTPAK